jgi:Zn-finger nucleic acid-binding protein
MDALDLMCPDCGVPGEPMGSTLLHCARCPRCQAILLPPELEELWLRMAELRADPRFWQGVDALDPRVRDAFANLMHIPRIWLADRRDRQVEEAIAAISRAISELEPPSEG